jgi:SAM-dependent methyltransferase
MGLSDPPPPSDALLRTMAPVPVASTVFVLGADQGRHTVPLLRLGFPVHTCDPRADAAEATRQQVAEVLTDDDAERCVRHATLDDVDYPEDAFDWVLALNAEIWGTTETAVTRLLETAHRALKPGGWCYLGVPAQPTDLEADEQSAGDGAAPDVQAIGATGPDAEAFTRDRLDAQREAVGFALSTEPKIVREHDAARLHVIYRRVQGSR